MLGTCLLVLLAPSAVFADQPPVEGVVIVAACDDAERIEQIHEGVHVELGESFVRPEHRPRTPIDLWLRIGASCDRRSASVQLLDERSTTEFRREVSLAGVPARLHARSIALIAAELVRVARIASLRLMAVEPVGDPETTAAEEAAAAAVEAEPEAPPCDLPAYAPRFEDNPYGLPYRPPANPYRPEAPVDSEPGLPCDRVDPRGPSFADNPYGALVPPPPNPYYYPGSFVRTPPNPYTLRPSTFGDEPRGPSVGNIQRIVRDLQGAVRFRPGPRRDTIPDHLRHRTTLAPARR
jgi:hypothetical protein